VLRHEVREIWQADIYICRTDRRSASPFPKKHSDSKSPPRIDS